MKKKRVWLQPAGAKERHIVENLVHFYVYDGSEQMGWACPEDGMFRGCSDVPGYFEKPKSRALLIRVAKELAGFVLVDGYPARKWKCDYRIGQFFVLRKFRRSGVGKAAARQAFDQFRGRWVVEYLKQNHPAPQFWRKVISDYLGKRVKESTVKTFWGEQWVVRFRNDEA